MTVGVNTNMSGKRQYRTDISGNRAAYVDLCCITENMGREIIDGEVVQTRPLSGKRVICATALGAKVTTPYQFGQAGRPACLLPAYPGVG